MSSPPPSPKSVASVKDKAPKEDLSVQSKRINDEVEAASTKFKAMKQKLGTLLGAVKDHHASMLDLSEKRIKEARQFELLMNGSLLEGITGKTNYEPPPPASSYGRRSTKVDDNKDDKLTKSELKSGNVSPKLSPKAGGKKQPEKNEANEAKVKNALAPVVVDRVVVEKSDPASDDNIVVGDPPSLGAVSSAAHHLTLQYAARHKTHIWTYIEDWDRVVTSKVQGRMIEYEKLRDNLKHYEKKVREMRDDMAKQEGKNKSVTGKRHEKMDRNEIKLEGAKDAHGAYGETLILLLEEVTDRAWRDMFPLLAMELKFQSSFYAHQAEIFAKLEDVAENLAKIGEENEAVVGGRLKSIKEKRPEEIYTGEREMVSLPKSKVKEEHA